MKRAMWLIFPVLLTMGSGTAWGQTVVRLETNYPQAMVFADSVWLGPASRGLFAVPEGTRALRLVPPAADAWAIRPETAALAAVPGDTLALRVDFPYYYRLETIPFDVPVYLEADGQRVELGRTPFTHVAAQPLEGMLLIDQPGFVVMRQEPGGMLWNHHALALQPVNQIAAAPSAEVAWRPPPKRRLWIDAVALTTAVVGGVVAVHYKIKADNRYDEYRESGDPALRPRIEQLDRYSGVALGAMQVGVGVFAIRLILR